MILSASASPMPGSVFNRSRLALLMSICWLEGTVLVFFFAGAEALADGAGAEAAFGGLRRARPGRGQPWLPESGRS